MSPGDITPKWEEAAASAKGNTASVDVPVIPTYRYRAIRSEYTGGRAKAYSVDVWQKLVIVRKHYEDGGEEKMGQYILTLIPDKGYAGRHKGNVVEKFVNNGDNGSYSGLAVYYCRGVPMRMDRYVDGQKVGGISVFGETDAEIISSRLKMIFKELGTIEFLKGRVLLTRSGEDFWDDDWYYGGELDPSIVTEEWPAPPDPVDDDDDWYEPPVGEDIDIWEDVEGGNEWGYEGWVPEMPEDEPEKPTGSGSTGTPSTLSEHYGKPSYYDQGVLDFLKRYPELLEKDAPKYYVEYGKKYFQRFTNNDTKPKLSSAGQEWVDDTSVALQVKLSNILIENPGIELDESLLKEKAFESHVDAYIESGLLELPMSDKIQILFTVDFKDSVLDPLGREQILIVGEKQLEYYIDCSYEFIRKEAIYFQEHVEEIYNKVVDLLNGGKTKSISYETPEEVFDLLFGQLIDFYEENVPEFSLPAGY